MTTSSTAPDQLFGYDVLDSAGNKIGTVDGVWIDDATSQLEFVGVKTGWIFGKTHLIPTENAQIDDANQSIQAPFSEEQMKDAPSFGVDDELSPSDEEDIYSYYGLQRSTAPSPTGLGTDAMASDTTAATSDVGTTDSAAATDTLEAGERERIPLSEETIDVGKKQVQTGQVRLRKVVKTEQTEVPVELRREEVQVERVPASGQDVPDTAFTEQEINVPVMEERPVVAKEAHVTGAVEVNKDVDTETQTVGGQVRKEDVEVDRDVDSTTATSPTYMGQTTTGTTMAADTDDDDDEGALDALGDKVERTVGKDF
jgi:uncharacterized protein (TIGR02271 family)